jgi:hypothetical protein
VNFTGGMQLQGSEFTGNEVVVFDLDGDGRFAAGMVRFETKDLRTATNAHIFAQGDLWPATKGKSVHRSAPRELKSRVNPVPVAPSDVFSNTGT